MQQEEEKIRLDSLVFSKRQAARLVHTLRRMARTDEHAEDAAKWKDLAMQLVEKGGGPYTYKRPAKRPKDDDAVALRRVLKGERPFPILSLADARRAFIRLNDRGMSARLMGERLYADRRTIDRWRKEYKEGKWKGKYEETTGW